MAGTLSPTSSISGIRGCILPPFAGRELEHVLSLPKRVGRTPSGKQAKRGFALTTTNARFRPHPDPLPQVEAVSQVSDDVIVRSGTWVTL